MPKRTSSNLKEKWKQGSPRPLAPSGALPAAHRENNQILTNCGRQKARPDISKEPGEVLMTQVGTITAPHPRSPCPLLSHIWMSYHHTWWLLSFAMQGHWV